MPLEYRKLGIAFQYPENWQLDEDEARQGRHSVTVYSPGGGFWSVSIHPAGTSPEKLARAAVRAMEQEYEGLEHEAAREIFAGRELAGYDLNFFYLDLTNSAAVRCLATPDATYAVFFQAEDHEFDAIRPVFAAMTTSLVSGLKLAVWPGPEEP